MPGTAVPTIHGRDSMRKFKMAVAVSVLASIALVGGVAAAGAFGPPGKITELGNYQHSDGGKNYLVKGPSPGAGHGCANSDWTTVIPSATVAQREQMAQTLLSAFLAGKSVQLNTAGSGNCVGNRPVYTNVHIVN
jgi:hypothetical protein